MLEKKKPHNVLSKFIALCCAVPTAGLGCMGSQPRGQIEDRLTWVLDRASNQNTGTGTGWQSILAVTECCPAPVCICVGILRDSLPLQGWLSRPLSVRPLLTPSQAKVQQGWSSLSHGGWRADTEGYQLMTHPKDLSTV